MEHSELVFPNREAAEQALRIANSKLQNTLAEYGIAPEPQSAELVPVLPEDDENPGTMPCSENDPEWKGEFCVFAGSDEPWAVTNEDLEWVFLA